MSNALPVAASHYTDLARVREAIETAASIPELKGMRNKAEAIRYTIKQAGHGLDAQNQVAELKLRAERRAGELLGETLRKPSQGRKPKASPDATLAALEVTRTQSSRWQAIASIPQNDFDSHIAAVLDKHEELTTASVLRLARPPGPEKNPPSPPATGDGAADHNQPSTPSPNGGTDGHGEAAANSERTPAALTSSEDYVVTAEALHALADRKLTLDAKRFATHRASSPEVLLPVCRAARQWIETVETLLAGQITAGR